MASEKRSADPDLEGADPLPEDPRTYHLFQALRLIEAAAPQGAALGTSRRPSDDPVRLGQAPELAFPTSTISDYAVNLDGPDRLTQQAFGLFGPNGALPLHLTEYARDRQRNHSDPTFTAFADMFHHRMLSLFYRAWASGQPGTSRGAGFETQIAALCGLAGDGFENRDAMPDVAKFHFAGHFGRETRSEAGLRAILSQFFDAEVEIESFVGSWLHLEPGDTTQLGSRSLGGAALGGSASLGEKVWSREAKFRVRIGPLSMAAYERLLPGREGHKRLAAIIRSYAGDTLDWDVNLVLSSDQVPQAALDGCAGLGRTSWIGIRPDAPAADLFLQQSMAS